MKKSKIIVPALGLLLLSAAASVSGTVAWFTAVRTYETSIGNFAVVSTKDNLECVLGAGNGTVLSADGKSLSVAASSKLADASFDHTLTGTNCVIYTPNGAGSEVAKTVTLANANMKASGDDGYTAATTLWRETLSDSTKIYTAFTWTMTFKLQFGADNRATGLFLDTNDTKSFLEDASGTSAGLTDTAKGFRIAFIPTAKANNTGDGYNRVWADLQTAAYSKHLTGLSVGDDINNVGAVVKVTADSHYYQYVNSGTSCSWVQIAEAATAPTSDLTDGQIYYNTASSKLFKYVLASTRWDEIAANAEYATTALRDKTTGSAYANPVTATNGLIDVSSDVDLPGDGGVLAANSATTATCLGTFNGSAGSKPELTFTCVAWFEGTDPSIVNGLTEGWYETVKANMSFGVALLG